jgi:acetate CoA/acetoacetate CoA-transferase beta subunit
VSLIVTDVAVIQVSKGGLVLKEIAPGFPIHEVQNMTGAKLIEAEDVKEIDL